MVLGCLLEAKVGKYQILIKHKVGIQGPYPEQS
jgi:hypothetical protein